MNIISQLTLALAGLTLAACGNKTKPAAPSESPAPKPAAMVTISGNTARAEDRLFPKFLRVTGQLAGEHDAIIAANATGQVVGAPVERGTMVKAGDVLARLDDRQPALSLAEALASVNMAKSRLALAVNEQQRNAPLAEKKAVADADYQKLLTEVAAREAELAAAEARHKLAQKSLDDCIIRAVFGGVVAERMVEPGEYVRNDSPVARVVALATLRLVLNVPETEVGGVQPGQTVEFTTAAYPGRVFTGKLANFGAAMREASRDLVIEATVDNNEGILRPGFFCDASIRLGEEKAIALPAAAVRASATLREVFVIGKDHSLSQRLVEVGATRDGFTEIRRGVVAGDAVLAQPGPDAADGARFQPAP